MRKTFLIIILLAALTPAFAQSVKLGISAGVNESKATVGETQSSINWLGGLNAGVFAEVEFGNLSLRPGVFFSQKGYKSTTVLIVNTPGGAPGSFNASGRIRLNYLEIPVNVLYNISISPGKIFLGGGPYYGYALSGHSKGSTVADYGNGPTYNNTEYDVEFGKDGSFKRSDFGLNAIAGIKLKNNLLFSVNYGFGLTNLIQSDPNEKVKNRVAALSVGYEFR